MKKFILVASALVVLASGTASAKENYLKQSLSEAEIANLLTHIDRACSDSWCEDPDREYDFKSSKSYAWFDFNRSVRKGWIRFETRSTRADSRRGGPWKVRFCYLHGFKSYSEMVGKAYGVEQIGDQVLEQLTNCIDRLK